MGRYEPMMVRAAPKRVAKMGRKDCSVPRRCGVRQERAEVTQEDARKVKRWRRVIEEEPQRGARLNRKDVVVRLEGERGADHGTDALKRVMKPCKRGYEIIERRRCVSPTR